MLVSVGNPDCSQIFGRPLMITKHGISRFNAHLGVSLFFSGRIPNILSPTHFLANEFHASQGTF